MVDHIKEKKPSENLDPNQQQKKKSEYVKPQEKFFDKLAIRDSTTEDRALLCKLGFSNYIQKAGIGQLNKKLPDRKDYKPHLERQDPFKASEVSFRFLSFRPNDKVKAPERMYF